MPNWTLTFQIEIDTDRILTSDERNDIIRGIEDDVRAIHDCHDGIIKARADLTSEHFDWNR